MLSRDWAAKSEILAGTGRDEPEAFTDRRSFHKCRAELVLCCFGLAYAIWRSNKYGRVSGFRVIALVSRMEMFTDNIKEFANGLSKLSI